MDVFINIQCLYKPVPVELPKLQDFISYRCMGICQDNTDVFTLPTRFINWI